MLSSPENILYEALYSLDPTNENGLEGLVRKLFEQWTGQPFFLSRSGDQAGADMASLANGNALKVRADTKRYRKGNNLNTREILGEIEEAFQAEKDLDLWVLFSTNNVSEQLARKVQDAATEKGLEALIIHMGGEHNHSSAVFCAQFPEIVCQHFKDSDKYPKGLESALENIKKRDYFDSSVHLLKNQIGNAALGFCDAASRTSQKLLEAFSDLHQAKAIFSQNLNILDKSSVKLIPRETVFSDLDKWWGNWSKEKANCVLLGEEGAGKTWCAASWLAQKLKSDNSFPTTLFFTYNRLQDGTPVAPYLFGSELGKLTKIRDARFWMKRLDRMQHIQGNGKPTLFVVFDGINEKPNGDWRSLLSQILDGYWNGQVAILMTCRPSFWNRKMSGTVACEKMDVPGYNDQELSQALSHQNIKIDTIPSELQQLIRKPRYCDLVSKHYDELIATRDLTVERLLYLDWKDRYQRKDNLPIDDNAFSEILCDLASQCQGGIKRFTKREIEQLGNDPRVLEELIEGSVFEETNRTGQYKVERKRLSHALGLLLCEELAEKDENIGGRPSPAKLNTIIEELDRWLDPHPEMDIKAEIVQTAVFYSRVKDQFPECAKQALIQKWVGFQNLPANGEEVIVQYANGLILEYLQAIEFYALLPSENQAAHDRLLYAILSYLEENDGAVLAPFVNRWLGYWNVNGHPAIRGHKDEHIDTAITGIQERLGTVPKIGPIEIGGYTVEGVVEKQYLSLMRIALTLVSIKHQQEFTRGIIQWGIAHAIIHYTECGDAVDWICHLCPKEFSDEIKSVAKEFLKSDNRLLQQAAVILLGRIKDENFGKEFNTYRSTFYPPREDQIEYENDPCNSIYTWERRHCLTCLEDEKTETKNIISNAHKCAQIPNAKFTEDSAKEAQVFFSSLDVMEIWKGLSRSIEDNRTDNVFGPILARTNPSVYACLYRDIFSSINKRKPGAVKKVITNLKYYLPVLKEDQKALAITSHEEMISDNWQHNLDDFEWDLNDLPDTSKWYLDNLAIARLSWLNGIEQAELLLSAPENTFELLDQHYWYKPISQQQAKILLLRTQGLEPYKIYRVLGFLSHSSIVLDSEMREIIRAYLLHSEPAVRWYSLFLTDKLNDSELALTVFKQGKCYNDWGENRRETYYASRLLARNLAEIPFEDLASRMDVGSLGYALIQRGKREKEIDYYSLLIDTIFKKILELPAETDFEKLSVTYPYFKEDVGTEFPLFTLQAESNDLKTQMDEMSKPPEDRERLWQQYYNELSQRLDYNAKSVNRAWAVIEFNTDSFELIIDRHPNLVQEWCEIGSLINKKSVLYRGSNFYLSLVRALFRKSSQYAVPLWEELKQTKTLISFKDRNIRFDGLEILLLEAPLSAETLQVKNRYVDECWLDDKLRGITIAARMFDQEGWLHKVIENYISSDQLWQKAKGLTLASFAGFSEDKWEKLYSKANVEHTWVDDLSQKMRENRENEDFAKHWYREFWEKQNADESWAALQILKLCIDSRFWLWKDEIESEFDMNAPLYDFRSRYVEYISNDLQEIIKKNEKRLKETLFFKKLPRTAIFPFIYNSKSD